MNTFESCIFSCALKCTVFTRFPFVLCADEMAEKIYKRFCNRQTDYQKLREREAKGKSGSGSSKPFTPLQQWKLKRYAFLQPILPASADTNRFLLGGNNFQKIKLLAKLMGLHCINKSTYYKNIECMSCREGVLGGSADRDPSQTLWQTCSPLW